MPNGSALMAKLTKPKRSGLNTVLFCVNSGCIDQDEQYKRFKERENDPDKEWKITEEDWRNREKWPAYEAAVNEMLIRTSTDYAPWTVVEANSKYYARIKVLKTVINAIEKAIK